jgi:hypothetical protein
MTTLHQTITRTLMQADLDALIDLHVYTGQYIGTLGSMLQMEDIKLEQIQVQTIMIHASEMNTYNSFGGRDVEDENDEGTDTTQAEFWGTCQLYESKCWAGQLTMFKMVGMTLNRRR